MGQCALVVRRRASLPTRSRPHHSCRVVKVEYVIANDGSDHTLAQLTLSLADEASPLRVSLE